MGDVNPAISPAFFFVCDSDQKSVVCVKKRKGVLYSSLKKSYLGGGGVCLAPHSKV